MLWPESSHPSSCNQNEALIPVVLNLIQQNKNNRFTSSFVLVFLAPSCDALTGAETRINNQPGVISLGFEVGLTNAGKMVLDGHIRAVI